MTTGAMRQPDSCEDDVLRILIMTHACSPSFCASQAASSHPVASHQACKISGNVLSENILHSKGLISSFVAGHRRISLWGRRVGMHGASSVSKGVVRILEAE